MAGWPDDATAPALARWYPDYVLVLTPRLTRLILFM
jgi:hypothetical protein